MKVVKIPNGIIHLAESKAKCPYCQRKIPIDEIEPKFMRQDKNFIRMKCKCNRFIGITSNIIGDYVAFNLNDSKLSYEKKKCY